MTSPSRFRRMSENTLFAIIGAAAVAVLSAGTAVAFTTTKMSIMNEATGTMAHVTAQKSLVTSQRDPYNGHYAKVDADGRAYAISTEAAPKHPGTARAVYGLGPGSHSGNWEFSFDGVRPAGKTFVIESISAYADAPDGQRARVFVSLTDKSVKPTYLAFVPVPLSVQPSLSTTFDTLAGAVQSRLYNRPAADPLRLEVSRSADTGSMTLTVYAHGYFI